MKKYKLYFLLDQSNDWIENYLKKFNFKLRKKYSIYFTKSLENIRKSDIIFVMNYTKKINSSQINSEFFVYLHQIKHP